MVLCDVEYRAAALVMSAGCYFIASLAWFFSSQPRQFIRTFVPPHELRRAAGPILRDPHYRRGMRAMAVLQGLIATMFALFSVACFGLAAGN